MESATGFGVAPAPILPAVPSIADAISQCCAAKLKANRRQRYVTALGQTLRQFAKGREAVPVSTITAAAVREWIDGRTESAHARASRISRVATFLKFATRRGWLLPVTLDLERVRIEAKPPRILSVAEARALLDTAPRVAPDVLPAVVLGLFAGVRPEESRRVAWADVNLDTGNVVISAAASKVRQRRIVPLCAAAVAWLRLGGSLPMPAATFRRRIRSVREAMGWAAWPQDVLRHTAASYLLAREQDAAKVALWLGNSPAILFRHYRELVTREAAGLLFELKPNTITP